MLPSKQLCLQKRNPCLNPQATEYNQLLGLLISHKIHSLRLVCVRKEDK
jgi:hypothetical protein